jgi:hypothetical protein
MTDNLTDNDEAKIARLPKWAQSELDRLTKDVAYWKAKATEGPEDSDTAVAHGGHPEVLQNLQPGARVLFQTGAGMLEAHVKDGRLAIRCERVGKLRAGGYVKVLPHSSNVILVDVEAW